MGYTRRHGSSHDWFNSKLTQNTTLTNTKEETIMARSNNSNQLVVPGVQQALDQMKYEIATEFGVQLGGETTSRANGSVGGEITKRLVQMAEQQLGGFQR
jgi:small acid-soluble spore protein B (major beta-type SASP)